MNVLDRAKSFLARKTGPTGQAGASTFASSRHAGGGGGSRGRNADEVWGPLARL